MRLARFSYWHIMKKCIARILRLKPKSIDLRTAAGSSKNEPGMNHQPLRVEELQRDEDIILKLVQSCVFSCEVETLPKIQRGDCKEGRHLRKAKKSEIKKTSTLFRHDPVLDQNGLMRVGGRLNKSQEFPEDFEYPVILPKKSFVVDLIIREAHERLGHARRGITISELRSRYWIFNTNSIVRHLIAYCVTCSRLRCPLGEQNMADLPKERITSYPPFAYSGVDYFGPFCIKKGRKELKRYCVFHPAILMTWTRSRRITLLR